MPVDRRIGADRTQVAALRTHLALELEDLGLFILGQRTELARREVPRLGCR